MAQLALDLGNLVLGSGVKAVYGEPTEIQGATVMPVALVGYGFGGANAPEKAGDPASGGGAGGYALPVGAYVKQGDELTFEPNIVVLAGVAIPLIWVAGHAMARIIRALKR